MTTRLQINRCSPPGCRYHYSGDMKARTPAQRSSRTVNRLRVKAPQQSTVRQIQANQPIVDSAHDSIRRHDNRRRIDVILFGPSEILGPNLPPHGFEIAS